MTAIDTAPPTLGSSGASPRRDAIDALIIIVVCGAMIVSAYATGLTALAPGSMVVGSILAWYLLRRRGEGIAAIGFAPGIPIWKTVLLGVGATLGVLIGAGAIITAASALTGLQADVSAFENLPGNPAALAGILAIAWTTAAFGEEIVFRGFLMRALARIGGASAGAWIAALFVQAVLFGFSHAYQGPFGIFATGVVGLLMGAAYLLTKRNIWVVILTHGLYDTVGLLALYSGVGLGGSKEAEGAGAALLMLGF